LTPKPFLLLFCLWLGFAGETQSLLRYQFTHISPDQGLSSTFVRKIVQDPYGFIWAGTQDGLNRFDGKRIKIYTKSNIKNKTLAGADIRDLLIDSIRHTLWVITSYGGINGIDYRTGNVWFSFHQQNDHQWKHTLFNSLFVDGPNLYIGSSQGLLRLDLAKKTIRNELLLPYLTEKESVTIDRLLPAKGQGCWMITEQKGVLYVDLANKTVIASPKRDSNEIFKTYDATLLQNGDVLLATSKGLQKASLHHNQVTIDTAPFPFLPSSLTKENFACHQDKSGNILISNAQFIIRFRPEKQYYALLSENSSADLEKWLSSVYSIYTDRQGLLWIGSQQGLAFADNVPSPFYRIYQSAVSTTRIAHAYYLYPANDTILYSCAQNGLYRAQTGSGIVKAIKEGIPFYHVFQGPRSKLIASSREGAFVLTGNQLKPLAKSHPEFSRFGPLVFNSHAELNDSILLLGTQNFKGLIVWNVNKKAAYQICDSSQGIRLQENVINGLYLDKRKNVWILGDRSISILDRSLQHVQHLTPTHADKRKYYSIFFDVAEAGPNYYLASYGNGIVVLDSAYQFVQELTMPGTLPANSVYKTLVYRDSLLFVTTNNGLAMLTLQQERQPRFFFKTDGLHSNTFEENSGTVYREKIYAGGEKGITLISPALITPDLKVPMLYLDEVRMESTDSVQTLTDLTIQEYEIPNTVLQTTLNFCALHYKNISSVRFAYKISELHDQWIDLGTTGVLPLIGMQPGSYTLLVKASSGTGIETKPLQIKLYFLPKWYQTWWFKMGLVLLFLGVFYSLYHYRIAQIRKQEAIRRTIASDLHDDVGSTLNSIKIFAHLAKTTAQPIEYLRQIESSVQQTSVSLRDIIWVLDDQADSVQEWMERIKKFAMPICRAKGISFHRLCCMNKERIWICVALK
jgi:ligand-binding sensor domain-containing protein